MGIAGLQLMRDGVHEVRLAEADATIEEKRVEGDGTTFRHALGRGMRQLVRLADHEGVEGKTLIERRAGQRVLCGCFLDDRIGDSGLFCHRGGFGARRLGALCPAHGEGQPAHLGTDERNLGQQHVPVVRLYVASEKVGRRQKGEHALGVHTAIQQRLDPGFVIVLPDGRADLLLKCDPLVSCHFYSSSCSRPRRAPSRRGAEPRANPFHALPGRESLGAQQAPRKVGWQPPVPGIRLADRKI